jgi:hypothetical protein
MKQYLSTPSSDAMNQYEHSFFLVISHLGYNRLSPVTGSVYWQVSLEKEVDWVSLSFDCCFSDSVEEVTADESKRKWKVGGALFLLSIFTGVYSLITTRLNVASENKSFGANIASFLWGFSISRSTDLSWILADYKTRFDFWCTVYPRGVSPPPYGVRSDALGLYKERASR